MQSKGLKTIARNSFFDRIEKEVETKGSTLVKLRAKGSVQPDDLLHFARTQGWESEVREDGIRVGRKVTAA